MNEATILADLVAQHYGIQGTALAPLFSSTGKRIYSVEQPGGARQVLRAYHQADSNTANPLNLAALLLSGLQPAFLASTGRGSPRPRTHQRGHR